MNYNERLNEERGSRNIDELIKEIYKILRSNTTVVTEVDKVVDTVEIDKKNVLELNAELETFKSELVLSLNNNNNNNNSELITTLVDLITEIQLQRI